MAIDHDSQYGKFKSRPLRFLYRFWFIAIISHWIFQSMFYMDTAERWFKIGLDIILTCLFCVLFELWLPFTTALILSFLIAHTFNYLFNGHFWGVLKNYGYVHTSYEDYIQYVNALAKRVKREEIIQQWVVIGSEARNEWTPQSDLDARILYKSGIRNSFHICVFLMAERTRALVSRFPLDLYSYAHESTFLKVIDNEPGINLIKQ